MVCGWRYAYLFLCLKPRRWQCSLLVRYMYQAMTMPTSHIAETDSGRTLPMSGVYLVTCHSCAYSQGLKFGVGAMYSNLDRAICLVNRERRSQIREISKNNGLSEKDFGYRAFHCSSCKNLSDGFWVRIENGSSHAYETKFHCTKCGERMKPITNPDALKAFPCPNCYNANLGLIRVMPWD